MSDDISKPMSQSNDELTNDELMMEYFMPPIGIFSSSLEEKSFNCPSIDSLKFILFQTFVHVLIGMKHDLNALKEMLNVCRLQCSDNIAQLKQIDDFQREYKSVKAIYYYTLDSFLFRKLNQAFRYENIDCIFRFRYYITDLYWQLHEMDQQERPRRNIRLYRGKKLPIDVLQQLIDNIHGLISINGFVSTTVDEEVAKVYAGIGGQRNGYESVVFEINIDKATTIPQKPYANISTQSCIKDEREYLLSMGFIWYIDSVEKSEDNFWKIKLRSCIDTESKVIEHIDQLKGDCSFFSLGMILRELGDYANAKNFYQRTLDDPTLSDETRGRVYYNMGLLADEQGEFMTALDNFTKALELIKLSTIPNNGVPTASRPLYAHSILPSRLNIWNNIGRQEQKKGAYDRAYNAFEKALNEVGSETEIATVYNNLGLLEFGYGEYEESQKHFTKAVKLAKNHIWVTEFKKNLDMVNKHISSLNNVI
jgi:tetratricopeptide (TPR) repeat protein